MQTADVESACRSCGVGIGEYLTARRVDPAFGVACMELDVVVRAAAVATLEAAAARGSANVGKLKLLLAGIDSLRLSSGDGPPAENRGLPPGAPAWLPELVERICARPYDLTLHHAVEEVFRRSVEFARANPGAHHYDFPFPGPCVYCRTGMVGHCPNPRCAWQFIAQHDCSDAGFPAGSRWLGLSLVKLTPVEDVEQSNQALDALDLLDGVGGENG